MSAYFISKADQAFLPEAYNSEPRQLGLADHERALPYARFFAEAPRPVQAHILEALVAGPQPGQLAYEVEEAASRLNRRGHERMENGWATTDRGTLVVSCLTNMPGVTAAMWDWWFGWHSRETARYKLWHPTAHQFSALGEDRGRVKGLTDRQKYINNVSFVDEYIGDRLQRLAIRFVDPLTLGFNDCPETTHICARVGASDVPLAGGWLIHQVRPTKDGSEMRSRFFLGHPEILSLPSHAVSNPTAAKLLSNPLGRVLLKPAIAAKARDLTSRQTGMDLLYHCATEMNHLAGFLSELHSEFKDSI